MRIYLVGMPGSGKTTFGKLLAKRLSYSFADLDERIVQAEGMPVSELFDTQGEAYFREIESQELKCTINETHVIVATGGGTPCFTGNMDWMNQNGLTVFLNIPLDTIVKRLGQHARQKRPLFAGKNDEDLRITLAAMHEKRLPFYQQAQLHLTEPRPEIVADYLNQYYSD